MRSTIKGLHCLILFAITIEAHADQQVVFREDWEFGRGSWTVSNGVWEVGEPTAGPGGAKEGLFCAGTVLGGNYPHSKTSRLVSPIIQLPDLQGDDQLMLNLWQWFRFVRNSYGDDYGRVEIYKQSDGTWNALSWNLGIYQTRWNHGRWNLSGYAGQEIRLGFYFRSNTRDAEHGWFIDDISITCGPQSLINPETFEDGMGDWSWQNGIWEVGIPTAGPGRTPSGRACAGTRMNGHFWARGWSRMVSPPIELDPKPGMTPTLHLQSWYQLPSNSYGTDYGYVQISVDGGNWETLKTVSGYSSGWEPLDRNLSAHIGRSVRIGFYFVANTRDQDDGWFIDNVQISGIEEHWRVTFETFGQGVPGSGDYVPSLFGQDGLATGEYGVRVTDGLGATNGVLWVGFCETLIPGFFGGEFYIDTSCPWVAIPLALHGSGEGGGFATFPGASVTNVLGSTLVLQGTFLDPGAPFGVSTTNGLRLHVTQD